MLKILGLFHVEHMLTHLHILLLLQSLILVLVEHFKCHFGQLLDLLCLVVLLQVLKLIDEDCELIQGYLCVLVEIDRL